MALKEPSFTIGIEEEYLLIDRETLNLAADPPKALFSECEALLGSQVAPEFLRAQIEIGTRVCTTVQDAAADLRRLRKAVSGVAERHGLAIMAASTHPFAAWGEQSGRRRTAITNWPRTCRAWSAGWSSAACTSMSASTTTTCAST